MSYHHKSGAQKRREKAMRAEGVKGQNTHGFAGVETRDTPMSASGPIRKTWGGQTCQPARIRRETHAFEVSLTLSRLKIIYLTPESIQPHAQ